MEYMTACEVFLMLVRLEILVKFVIIYEVACVIVFPNLAIYIYISGDSSLYLLLVNPPPALCQLKFPTRGPWTQSKSS